MTSEHKPTSDRDDGSDRRDAVILERFEGTWGAEDPNANLKADVALYSRVDPLVTITALSEMTTIPVGALVRYVLARYASGGSSGLLEIGPSMVNRLWEPVERAERDGSETARLEAYEQLREMIAWLRAPLAASWEEAQ